MWWWVGWRAALVCLLIGVVLTVGVAWGVTVWEAKRYLLAPKQGLNLYPGMIPATPAPPTRRPAPTSVPGMPEGWLKDPVISEHRALGLTFMDALGEDLSVPGAFSMFFSTDAGVPFRAMRKQSVIVTGRSLTHPWHVGLAAGDVQLPIKPIFPGFLINTIFWAAIPYAVLIACRALRARRRAKRGLCIRCGYSIGDFARCPECGAVTGGVSRGVLVNG